MLQRYIKKTCIWRSLRYVYMYIIIIIIHVSCIHVYVHTAYIFIFDLFSGESLVLSVVVDEEVEAANATTATILSPDGTVLNTLQLNYSGAGNYLAFFDAPSSLFQIQLTGVDSRDNAFTRIDRTGVDPTDVLVSLGTYVYTAC